MKKKIIDRIIKNIWTLFKTEEEKIIKEEIREKNINDRLIKDRIIRYIRTFFEQQEEKDYYELKRIINFWNNNYIEYKSNGDRNRNLLIDEFFNKI